METDAVLGKHTDRKNFIHTRGLRFLSISAAFLSAAAPVIALQAHAPRSAPPAAQAPAQIQLPPAETMIILIRSSLVALGQANITNNYTVLNALGSRNFQAANPPQNLANTFQSFRANRIDLSPVVLINPQLTAQPVMANGKLRLIGNFPSKPMQVNFDMTFEPDQGVWRLFALGVNLSPTPNAAQLVK